jgi:hypothetical protein
MLLLSRRDAAELVGLEECIAAVEGTFRLRRPVAGRGFSSWAELR